MEYRFRVVSGKVAFLMRSGNELVRNSMPETTAETIVLSTGRVSRGDNPDYPIVVDDKYMFAGTIREDEPEQKVQLKKGGKR